MKRYSIPLIFFSVGLLLQFSLHFSWITLGLLMTSTLFLSLLIFTLGEMARQPVKYGMEPQESYSIFPVIDLPEPMVQELPEKERQLTSKPPIDVFNGENPLEYAHAIRHREQRILFSETVKENLIALDNAKVSSILYGYFDGTDFTECIWQKGQLVIDSDLNDIEWEEFEEEAVRKKLPCLNFNNQKLYLPLSINDKLLGVICIETKEKFIEKEVSSLLLTTLSLAEKLLEKNAYFNALHHADSSLFNKAHFYTNAKTRFLSLNPQTLVLLKLMKKNTQLDIAICLNQISKLKGFTDLGLFYLEDHLLACFIQNRTLEDFTNFIQAFVEELDCMGYECEIALGYSSNKSVGLKFDQWIKNAYHSLEESILSHAA